MTNDNLTCAIEGLMIRDAICPASVTTTIYDRQVDLAGQGASATIKTHSRLTPGSKVTTPDHLQETLCEEFLRECTVGGGNFNVASALGLLGRTHQFPAFDIKLIDAGNGGLPSGIAAHYCGVGLIPQRPINLVIHLPNDRGIIKEEIIPVDSKILRSALSHVRRIARESQVVVSASSKSPELAIAMFESANGAKYFNPTGSLPPATTRHLLAEASDLVMNFKELGWIAGTNGLRVGPTLESDGMAPHDVSVWLHGLKRRGICGRESALATLGGAGCVVADWLSGQISHLALQVSPEAARPTRQGAGDFFLGAYVAAMETWAKRGILEAPAESAAIRATHLTCEWLGIPDTAFEVRVIRM